MLNQKKRKRDQVKVSRTETVAVRLDPKLYYFADLAARTHRRSLSDFFRWVMEKELKTFQFKENDELTAAERMSDLWDVDEKVRLMKLASYCPSLLSYSEEIFLKDMQQNRKVIEASQA